MRNKRKFGSVSILLVSILLLILSSCGPVVMTARVSEPPPPWFYPNRLEVVRYVYFPEYRFYYDLSTRVALPKPTAEEKGQWYFQRYINQLPRQGKIVFFDRSWYNRAVVEPVNSFCTQEEYNIFMDQVNDFERMIIQSGIRLVKLYFSITKEEQAMRFEAIKSSPIKKWKFSKVDQNALKLWDDYTEYKRKMFEQTNTDIAPWTIIKANKKTKARIEAIEHILSVIPYNPKDEIIIKHIEIEDEVLD